MNSNIQIYLNKTAAKKIASGYPWIYLSDISNQSTFVIADSTELAHVYSASGDFIATAIIDKTAKIALRVISTKTVQAFDHSFFKGVIDKAIKRRVKLNGLDYCRVINYEGDYMPGLCIDRFGDHFHIHSNMEFYFAHASIITHALINMLAAKSITMSGYSQFKQLYGDCLGEPVIITENGSKFYCDIANGQKTGWYYDQRDNRKYVSSICQGKKLLDCFCYSGGFGLNALMAGANFVTFIDSSQGAIDLVKSNAALNDIDPNCYQAITNDATRAMEMLEQSSEKYDAVILDPPPFIKNKADKPQALKKYRKLITLALKLLESDGHIFFSTCSHYMSARDLRRIFKNFNSSRQDFQLIVLEQTEHAIDHPVHPALPEGRYLNSILVKKIDVK